MRFSIYLNAQTRGPEEDTAIIETLVRQAVDATHRGFDGIALTEHHFSGYNTYGDNFMLAAHLAPQVPPGTKFFLAVAVPTLHNPMRLAQLCTVVDQLTKGEVIVGFAAGGSPVEYAGLGRDPSKRHTQMFENLAIVEEALTKKPDSGPFSWTTEFESGTLHTRIMPSGFHRSHPPFARATQNDEGVTWTGHKGWFLFSARETPDNVARRWRIYESALRAGGLSSGEIEERLDWSLLQKQVYLADTDEQAEREIRARLKLMAEHQRRTFSLVSDLRDAAALKSVVGVTPQLPDEFIQHALLIGSPASVVKQIREYADAGVRHMSLLFNYGFMTPEESTRNLERFITDVLPRVSSAVTTGGM